MVARAQIRRPDPTTHIGSSLQALPPQGIHRVGVDEIATASIVTKRTLYYHFRSKDALLEAVLASQHKLAFAAFQTFGDKLIGSPEQIVDTFFRELTISSAKPRWVGSGFTRLAIELADLPGHPARAIARKHKAILEAHFAQILAKVHVVSPHKRAREIWLLAEGAMALILIHGDRSYAESAARAAKQLLRKR